LHWKLDVRQFESKNRIDCLRFVLYHRLQISNNGGEP
jgi:hypothetical protein